MLSFENYLQYCLDDENQIKTIVAQTSESLLRMLEGEQLDKIVKEARCGDIVVNYDDHISIRQFMSLLKQRIKEEERQMNIFDFI